MTWWTTYEIATGRITGAFSGDVADSMLEDQVPDGQSLVPGRGDADAEMVVGSAIVPRPELGAFDPVNPPPGCAFIVWNEAGAFVRSESEPVTLTDAGSYRLLVMPAWPYRSFEREVTVP